MEVRGTPSEVAATAKGFHPEAPTGNFAGAATGVHVWKGEFQAVQTSLDT